MTAIRELGTVIPQSGDTSVYSAEFKIAVSGLLERGLSLLDQYEERDARDDLMLVILRILSASKMEDHPEVVAIAEHIKNICEATISGKIIPSKRTAEVIRTSMLQLSHGLQKDNLVLEPSLIENLKSILRGAKSDDKDYLFLKKIHVLLIDDDEFAQMQIAKNIGSSINLEVCSTVDDASNKLKKVRFDAVLCNIELNDKHIIDFISEFSRSLPIVAISGSEDPKLVQIVGKAGVRDYVVKNDSGIKWITRSLHKVTNEWTRKSRITDDQKLLMRPSVRKILKVLMGGVQLRQQIHSIVEFDSKSVNSLRDHEKTLKSLLNAGYISKEPTQLKLACPTCKSINLMINYLCQNCKASNFTRGNVLEHNKCGHSDLESNFQQNNKLVCPKCRKELKLIGVDYFRVISALKCRECQNIFTIPEISYDCSQCGNSGFSLSDGSWNQMYNYEISPEKLGQIKQDIISLSPIEEFLRQKGYEIRVDEMVTFETQSYGPFDFVAENKTCLILTSLVGSEIENALARLIDLDSASKHSQLKVIKYAILFSDPTEIARNLIEKFDIIPIILENEGDMLARFRENFRE
jgi:DNA-binding NarL/FixJ family response regulator